MKIRDHFPLPAGATTGLPAWLPVLASLFIIGVVTFLVLAQMTPPGVVLDSAPPMVFSAERAFEHLKTIASVPHPTGSSENTQVREYLINQLAILGLHPETQTSASVYNDTGKWGVAGPRGLETTPDTWSLAGATVHNIIARIPGTNSTGAIVLSAHYDSVPFSPGASDDGAGVAAMIETARALLASPPLRNDVVLLLADGEEIGLLGSQAFAKHHPWMEDVALVLNLEARGSSGVALMYETSLNNSWLISEYARAAKDPMTGSVATDVWRLMPNSTDLTTFLQAGKQGMNFAYSEDWTDYHTTHDSLEDLDVRSLQHLGGNLLAIAQHFGSIDLTTRTNTDAVFFSVLRLAVIQYPKGWAVPLMIIATAAFILVFGFGLRRGRLTLRGLAAGFLVVLFAMGAVALFAYLAVQGLNFMRGGDLQVGMGGTYHVEQYELGLLIVYLALTATIYAFFQQKVSSADLAAGGLIFWLVLTIGSTIALPGASYLFLWPLLAGLMVLGLNLAAARRSKALQQFLILIPVTAGLILFGTTIYLLQRLFGVSIYPVAGVMSVLIMGLVFPYLNFRALPHASVWAAGVVAIGILLFVWTGSIGYTTDWPRQNFLFYSMNADTGKAAWVASTQLPEDDTLSPWLGSAPRDRIMQDFFPGSWEEHVWTHDAPALDLPKPEMTIMEDKTEGDMRFVQLNLRSPRGAWAVMADITADGAILEGELYGERYSKETPQDHLFFKVIALPPEGVEIKIKLLAGTPVTIRLADVSLGLPPLENRTNLNALPLRTGFGGGHGVDGMTLLHRYYLLD